MCAEILKVCEILIIIFVKITTPTKEIKIAMTHYTLVYFMAANE
jgi:hypothetical protein